MTEFKQSFYNINVFEQGYTDNPAYKDLYYNVMSGKFAHIKDDQPLDIEELIEKRMVVKEDIDEPLSYKRQQEKAIIDDFPKHISLVIAITMKCNYQCAYCFEGCHKYGKDMDGEVLEDTINYIKQEIDRNPNLQSLSIQFFGGEPLFAGGLDALRRISGFVIPYCEQKNIKYFANITTNGYFLTKEISAELKALKVQKAMIALDGFEDNYANIRQVSKESFKRVLQNIEDSVIKVYVRLNVTKENQEEIKQLIEYLYTLQSVKEKRTTFVIYRVEVFDKDSTCNFTDKEWLKFRECLENFQHLENPQSLFAIPKAKGVGCGMLKKHNVCLCADGNIYRCDRQIGDNTKAIGTIKNGIDVTTETDRLFRCSVIDTTCLNCKFLPICGGDNCRYKYLYKGKSCNLIKGRFKQQMTNYLKYVYKDNI